MKRKPPKKPWPPPIYEIEWVDAYGGTDGEWSDMSRLSDPPSPLINRTVGYLVNDSPKLKRLMGSLTDPNHAESRYAGDGEMVIPTVCIVKMKRLTPKGR